MRRLLLELISLIPAQAGIQAVYVAASFWVPAYAGTIGWWFETIEICSSQSYIASLCPLHSASDPTRASHRVFLAWRRAAGRQAALEAIRAVVGWREQSVRIRCCPKAYVYFISAGVVQ